MIKKLPCLYGYINQTQTGNRNENLFKAINHLRHYNKTATMEDLLKEALQINKAFTSPLSEHEVSVICQHVIAKDYRTSCWKFKNYCRHCKYGKFHKLFKDSKPKYWKHINENNRLVGIKTIPDDIFYPWDIEDTSKIQDKINENGEVERKKEDIVNSILISREQRGIPLGIDTIVKAYGIPIGDKAKREWQRFKES